MIIQGGLVFNEDKTFSRRTLFIEKGVFVSSQEEVSDRSVIDARGLRVIPGLIDIHSHGAAGYDFSDDDAAGLQRILQYEYSCGVTSYCPTSMTLPAERLRALFSHAAETASAGAPQMARIAGFHMEGPFLAPSKRGAHREEWLQAPDIALFRACNAACGNRIRLVTVAPELEGAEEFIRQLSGETVVSLGHSNIGYDGARRAFEAGAGHVTHLFNAMSPLLHREPGLAGAALDRENCMAELIADGVHVHESVVRAAFRMFPDRVVLISDSMRAAGMPDGSYELGGQQVIVKGKYAVVADESRQPAPAQPASEGEGAPVEGTIAGSVTNLFECMRNAISFGVPAGDAIAAATMNPARSIGIFGEVGSITAGKRADVLLVDDAFRLVRVISGAVCEGEERPPAQALPSEDVDDIIKLLDQYTEAGGSRLRLDVVESESEGLLSRQYHHGRCDIGSPWAKGQAFDCSLDSIDRGYPV